LPPARILTQPGDRRNGLPHDARVPIVEREYAVNKEYFA